MTVTLLCVIPVGAGTAGLLLGPAFVAPGLAAAVPGGLAGAVDLDSHFRYLSGILLGIGLLFLSTVPAIERHSGRFRLGAGLVLCGGLARALSLVQTGEPTLPHLAGLVLELAVTPLLVLWQARVAAGQQG